MFCTANSSPRGRMVRKVRSVGWLVHVVEVVPVAAMFDGRGTLYSFFHERAVNCFGTEKKEQKKERGTQQKIQFTFFSIVFLSFSLSRLFHPLANK